MTALFLVLLLFGSGGMLALADRYAEKWGFEDKYMLGLSLATFWCGLMGMICFLLRKLGLY